LASVGLDNAAFFHPLPLKDCRFPDDRKILGTSVSLDHHRLCRGTMPAPAVLQAACGGAGGYLRVCDVPRRESRARVMRDLGVTAGCFFGAPDRATGQTSLLMANWFGALSDFERLFPMIQEQLELGAVFIREGLAVRQLVTERTGELLTPRERDCLSWVAAGRSSKAIADRLRLSTATVNEHITRATRKLGASSRAQACARAFIAGVVAP